jgi:hypothetical protein
MAEQRSQSIVKSVRVGRMHFHAFRTDEDSAPELRQIEFKSINRAKAESRVLGGAGAVRAFSRHPGDAEVKRLVGIAP